MAKGVTSRIFVVLSFGMLVCWGAAHAQQVRYVTDQLVLTLRAGPGERYEKLRNLSTGDAVEVLEVGDSGYARVRLANGLEGWLLHRYLTDTAVAETRLAQAETRVASLAAERDRLRELNRGLELERSDTEDTLMALRDAHMELQQEVARLRGTAREPQVPKAEHSALKRRVTRLQQQLSSLRTETAELRRDEQRKWFLYGGGVALGGILLGALLSRVRLRRRSWDRF